MNNQRILSVITLIVGSVMAVLSFLLPHGRGEWTDEQARNYSEAAADLHRLTYEAAEAQERAKQTAASLDQRSTLDDKRRALPADAPMPIDAATASPERATAALSAARKRYDEARAGLENAQAHSGHPMPLLLWLGVSVILFATWRLSRCSNQSEQSELH